MVEVVSQTAEQTSFNSVKCGDQNIILLYSAVVSSVEKCLEREFELLIQNLDNTILDCHQLLSFYYQRYLVAVETVTKSSVRNEHLT